MDLNETAMAMLMLRPRS